MTLWHWLILLVIVVPLAALWLWYVDRHWKGKLENAFRGRESLDDETFYDRFFRDQGVSRDVAVGVRGVMQEVLGADLSKLIAADDFSKNLKFFWENDSLADVELISGLEKKFNVTFSDQEASKLNTVNDIVSHVDQKVKQKAAEQVTAADSARGSSGAPLA